MRLTKFVEKSKNCGKFTSTSRSQVRQSSGETTTCSLGKPIRYPEILRGEPIRYPEIPRGEPIRASEMHVVEGIEPNGFVALGGSYWENAPTIKMRLTKFADEKAKKWEQFTSVSRSQVHQSSDETTTCSL
ncbi:hypothetical protein Bbelb_310800 [Branchiostoma belcheri]|nr:hypothetical protein Bbelb_310800 [Branchiostoma belcheri]